MGISAFTNFSESLKPLGELTQIIAGLGLITVLLASLKRGNERRSWRLFKLQVEEWLEQFRESEGRRPGDLQGDEWKAACERMLTVAKFSPMEINHLLDAAVIVSKGLAADRFFI